MTRRPERGGARLKFIVVMAIIGIVPTPAINSFLLFIKLIRSRI